MKDAAMRKKEARRLEGDAKDPEEKVPTYQELLDEALDETFPASDPIAPGAASRPAREVPSGRDDADWTLEPGSDAPARPGEAKNPEKP